jgi:hypothetical protein
MLFGLLAILLFYCAFRAHQPLFPSCACGTMVANLGIKTSHFMNESMTGQPDN